MKILYKERDLLKEELSPPIVQNRFLKKHAKVYREIYFFGSPIASVYLEDDKNDQYLLGHPFGRLFYFLNGVQSDFSFQQLCYSKRNVLSKKMKRC